MFKIFLEAKRGVWVNPLEPPPPCLWAWFIALWIPTKSWDPHSKQALGGEWSHPFCSRPRVESSKPMVMWWLERARTNHHVKGWHSRLKRIIGKPHPNIFEIIDVIKKEQATTEMKLEQFAAGATQPSRKKRHIQRDEKICKLCECFQNGESSLAG